MQNIKTIGSNTILVYKDQTVVIDSFGAKVLAFIEGDENRLFYDESDISHSGIPLCFPSFGPLKEGKLVVDGKQYGMNQHGFARDMEFDVEEISSQEALFTIGSTTETLARYPFEFTFSVLYTLDEKGLSIAFSWVNESDREAPLSPGVHPYFTAYDTQNIVLHTKAIEGNMSEVFSDVKELEESGFFTRNSADTLTVKASPDINLINHGMADNTLVEMGEGKTITLRYDDNAFDRLTIWRYAADVEFLCVEPANSQNKINDNPEMIPAGATWESVVEICL